MNTRTKLGIALSAAMWMVPMTRAVAGIEVNAGDWKIDFDTKTVDRLNPGDKREIVANVTPSAKAIAGDYMTTIQASGTGDSTSADFRMAVTTSTLWGIFGIGVIAIALLVLVGAVVRFGRR